MYNKDLNLSIYYEKQQKKLEEFISQNSLPNEEWRELPDTKRKYYVSNKGRVLSLCNRKGRLLRPYIRYGRANGGYYAGESKGITGKVKFKEGITKKGELSFKDGLLIYGTDENSGATTVDDTITTDEAKAIVSALHGLTNGAIGTARLGKLAWKDDVEISSASFNLGGSALSVGRPTISGDTATYQVTIPGQRYSAGSSERAHAYAWIDENDGLHVTCTTGSAPAGYNDSTNKKKAHDSCSAGSGGSGTTKNRTLTAKITVKAT